MLHAVYKRKRRNWNLGAEQSAEQGGDPYQGSEDLLAASVLCRLSYLPDEALWAVFRCAVVANHAIPESLGALEDISFWPKWRMSEACGRNRIEPDAFLTFEHGYVLIEAKRYDGIELHNPVQLAWEWVAAQEQEDVDPSLPIFVLALGGCKSLTTETAKKLEEQVTATVRLIAPECQAELPRLWLCSWQRILAAVLEYRATLEAGPVGRICDDIVLALALHGTFHVRWLAELTSLTRAVLIAAPTRVPWEERVQALLPIDISGYISARKDR